MAQNDPRRRDTLPRYPDGPDRRFCHGFAPTVHATSLETNLTHGAARCSAPKLRSPVALLAVVGSAKDIYEGYGVPVGAAWRESEMSIFKVSPTAVDTAAATVKLVRTLCALARRQRLAGVVTIPNATHVPCSDRSRRGLRVRPRSHEVPPRRRLAKHRHEARCGSWRRTSDRDLRR